MDDATPRPLARALPAMLAGLQSGLVGALAMLAWLGVVAELQQRNFWIPVNLMASAFYGPGAVHSGFSNQTLSGLAFYVALYSLLGAALAAGLRDRLRRGRTFLVSMLFALGWYYVSFRLLWKMVIPLLALLHVEKSTAFGHLIYGAVLGAYPMHLPRPAAAVSQSDAPPDPSNTA
jgi:hypothetical protein